MKTVTLKAFTKKLDNFANGKAIEEAVTKSCLLVEKESKNNCPVQTGTLRRSITTDVNGMKGEVYSPLDYAIWVHQGTGLFAVNGDGRQTPWSYQDEMGEWHTTIGQHPQPFLGPALEMNRETIINFIKERLENC